MSKRFFVDDTVTADGKFRVLQEDSETKERFGVKDFDTREDAQSNAAIMQKAADNAFSEDETLTNIDIENHPDYGDESQSVKDS